MSNKEEGSVKKSGKNPIIRRFFIVGLIVCCTVLLVSGTYMLLHSLGKNSLSRHAEKTINEELSRQLSDTVIQEEKSAPELQEGQILVEGQVYQYNQDILTFLFMGVDSRNGISKEKTPGEAGQADALLLVVINPRRQAVDVVAVNRDTMVDIEIYDTAGVYIGDERGQITLQYAYGNGREKSCELMEQAVSNLFFGIPIHGYGALDMDSISTLNDAVGGVEVTILDDMTEYRKDWVEGAKVLLSGRDALFYIRQREFQSKELGSNIRRVERQKQYLTLYVEKLKTKIKKDITFPLTLYSSLEKHMVTSLTMNEITYLAGSLMGYDFSMEHTVSIPGESVMGETNEEFYVDDGALKQIVIDLFYEKIDGTDIG
ncbi:MAG: LCP family protein [Lachnospiraceae bacterium]|nr:LCP family protein [Lachnospiraceae bacterium]